MKKKLKIFIQLLILILLAGCQSDWQPNLITDIHNLEGRKVGVNLAWEADYALTGRKDLELYRYDSTADLILALSYNKLDAIAVDHLTWRLFEKNSTGLKKIEPEIKTTGYLLYFKDEKLKNEYDQYLTEFKNTKEYEDFIQREMSFDGEYIGPEIELTGTGEAIVVAFDAAGYPRAFLDSGEDIPTGYDLEILKRFANEKNYHIDFVITNYDNAVIGLTDGRYDALAGYLSEEYANEARYYGLYTSMTMDEIPIYFVQKTQNKISIDMDIIEG